VKQRMRPLTRSEARGAVAAFHSHHKPHVQQILSIGYEREDGLITCACVVERPKARTMCDGVTWEVSRLAIGPEAPSYAASRLLGAVTRAAKALGIRRMISYTRADEPGTCYKASNWEQVAHVRGEPWTHGNKKNRWLPGFYVPSTEVVPRVRWEWRR
jgi:hypothetical protein